MKCEVTCIFGQFFYEHTIWLHNSTGKIGLLNSRRISTLFFHTERNFCQTVKCSLATKFVYREIYNCRSLEIDWFNWQIGLIHS